MVLQGLRVLAGCLIVTVVLSLTAEEARAGGRQRASTGLFSNYYALPGPTGTGAQLYVSPRPVPPLVGHTWITYQPLMPHNFLYQHRQHYVRQNPDGSRTRTRISWR